MAANVTLLLNKPSSFDMPQTQSTSTKPGGARAHQTQNQWNTKPSGERAHQPQNQTKFNTKPGGERALESQNKRNSTTKLSGKRAHETQNHKKSPTPTGDKTLQPKHPEQDHINENISTKNTVKACTSQMPNQAVARETEAEYSNGSLFLKNKAKSTNMNINKPQTINQDTQTSKKPRSINKSLNSKIMKAANTQNQNTITMTQINLNHATNPSDNLAQNADINWTDTIV